MPQLVLRHALLALDKTVGVIAGAHLKLPGELPVNRMFHRHIHHRRSLIDRKVKLLQQRFRRGVAAGDGVEPFGGLPPPLEQIAAGGGDDRSAPGPQQGDIPHDNLPADMKAFRQRRGADRLARKLQSRFQIGAAGAGAHPGKTFRRGSAPPGRLLTVDLPAARNGAQKIPLSRAVGQRSPRQPDPLPLVILAEGGFPRDPFNAQQSSHPFASMVSLIWPAVTAIVFPSVVKVMVPERSVR